MKSLSYSFVLISAALVACGAPTTVATAPTPAPATSPTTVSGQTAVTEIPAVRMSEPPKNWQLLDPATDGVPGISAERAINELLRGRAPKQTVLVAVIDNGIDTLHTDLRANLWTDKDGTHGWNFIGGADGKDVSFDTFEVTREYARCHGKAAASGAPPITDAARCRELDASFEKQRQSIERTALSYRQVNEIYHQIVPVLARAAMVSADSLTADRVRRISSNDPTLGKARQVYLELAADGASPSVVADGLKSLEGQLQYSLNPDYNPRTIVGDNYTDLSQRNY